MHRRLLIALGVVLATSAGALALGGEFAGPGPWITGNDTGGIIPYSPEVEATYKQMARRLLRALAPAVARHQRASRLWRLHQLRLYRQALDDPLSPRAHRQSPATA